MAKTKGKSVSEFVLERIFRGTSSLERFSDIVRTLDEAGLERNSLAELNDLLSTIPVADLKSILEAPRHLGASSLVRAYVASMLEQACELKTARIPPWLFRVPALPSPWFASTLGSLRMHLLLSSPPSFRKRNLFIDSSLGARV